MTINQLEREQCPVTVKRKHYLLKNINVNHGRLATHCVPAQEIIRREHLADYFDEIPRLKLTL